MLTYWSQHFSDWQKNKRLTSSKIITFCMNHIWRSWKRNTMSLQGICPPSKKNIFTILPRKSSNSKKYGRKWQLQWLSVYVIRYTMVALICQIQIPYLRAYSKKVLAYLALQKESHPLVYVSSDTLNYLWKPFSVTSKLVLPKTATTIMYRQYKEKLAILAWYLQVAFQSIYIQIESSPPLSYKYNKVFMPHTASD